LIVGFIVYSAARFAGMIKDPEVSEPMEMGAKPALTATADPEDEPPQFCDHVQQRETGIDGLHQRETESKKRTLWLPTLSLHANPPLTYTLCVCPPTADHPHGFPSPRKYANSDMFAFPRIIAPAASNPSTSGALA